jgi:hypothetical protein
MSTALPDNTACTSGNMDDIKTSRKKMIKILLD